jgi:hypothetical protein
LLTGQRPFKGTTDFDTLRKVMADEPVPPSRHRPQTPRDLETICLTCLHKEPARRYSSAEALAEDLRRFRMGEPIAARPVGRLERAVKWTRRNPAVAGLMGSLVLATVVAIFFAIWAFNKAAEAEKEKSRANEKAAEAEKEKSRANEKAVEAEKEKSRAEYALWIVHASRAWQQNRQLTENLAISSDDRRIVSACNNGVKVWDAATGQEKLTLGRHNSTVRSVAISSDGRRIVSGDIYGTVKVWDAATGQLRINLVGPRRAVLFVAISSDGQRVVSGGSYVFGGLDDHRYPPGTLNVWNAATGVLKHTLKNHNGSLTSLAMSNDGRRIVSGSAEDWDVTRSVWRRNTVKVWDAGTGQKILTLEGHSGRVSSVAISSDGRRMVSGSDDGAIRVWDVATGQEIHTFEGNRGPVSSVAISSKGRWVVSVVGYTNIKVWDAATGREHLTFRNAVRGTYTPVAISSDGRWIISGGMDGIRLWDAVTGGK